MTGKHSDVHVTRIIWASSSEEHNGFSHAHSIIETEKIDSSDPTVLAYSALSSGFIWAE